MTSRDQPDDAELDQRAASTIAAGSKSFAAAARLFRPEMRRDVLLLYTWCRHCDDVTDGQQLGHGHALPADRAALDRLRSGSLEACRGRPDGTLAFQALAGVCRRNDIDEALIVDHLRGFELDVDGWRPTTLDDTLEYCYCVAGAVGVMMARIMGVDDPDTLLRACDLGIAFQLTNIARDVVDDARFGRCYLPENWLAEANLSAGDLARPEAAVDAFPLVERLVRIAEPFYASARIGERTLPFRAAWAIATARGVYRDIGLNIIARGPEALARRSVTGRSTKIYRGATGGAQTLADRLRAPSPDPRPALWMPPGS